MLGDYTVYGFHGGNNLVLQTMLAAPHEPSPAICANSPREPELTA
jgi:hypothetical protein